MRGKVIESEDDDDDESNAYKSKSGELEFLSMEELEEKLSNVAELSEAEEELIHEIAKHLFRYR